MCAPYLLDVLLNIAASDFQVSSNLVGKIVRALLKQIKMIR